MAAARLLAFLLAAALGSPQVSPLEVYTPEELSVRNGTQVKLQCTFSSSEAIGSATSVTWSFQAEEATLPESFFYYTHGKAYVGKNSQFKGRVSWAGDFNKKDASINIANIQFPDNGTYICDVRNPPDILVTQGEIGLRVVERDHNCFNKDCDYLSQNYTQINIISLTIGGVVLLLLVFIVITDHLFWKEQRCKDVR